VASAGGSPVGLDIPVDSLASAADNPAASGNLGGNPASVVDNPAVARNPAATAAWHRGAGAAADFVVGRVVADS